MQHHAPHNSVSIFPIKLTIYFPNATFIHMYIIKAILYMVLSNSNEAESAVPCCTECVSHMTVSSDGEVHRYFSI